MANQENDPQLEEAFADMNILTPNQNILDNVITPNPSQYQSPLPVREHVISPNAPESDQNSKTVIQRRYLAQQQPNRLPIGVEISESPAISTPNMSMPPHPHTFNVPQQPQPPMHHKLNDPLASQPNANFYSPSIPYPFPFSNHGQANAYSQYPQQNYYQQPQYYHQPTVYPQASAGPTPPNTASRYMNRRQQQQRHMNQYNQYAPNNYNGGKDTKLNRRSYVRENFRGQFETEIESMSVLLSKGEICSAMQTQEGSRYIQNNFSRLNTSDREKFLQQVLANDIVKLSRHVFSNWVIQLIYQTAPYPACKKIVAALRNHIYNLSINTFGCRLIQKILSAENGEDNLVLKQMVVKELQTKVLQCLRNNNGHHVIEKALSHCPTDLSCFILQEIVPQLMTLAVDPFGCQIIELILKRFSFEHRNVQELMLQITNNISEMSRHRYGNYIVQDVIETAPLAIQDKMFKAIFEDIVELGCNKYSSNVVEKSIYLASNKRRRKLVRKILNDDLLHQSKKLDSEDDEESEQQQQQEESYCDAYTTGLQLHTILRKLIFDKYGNYVIQTLLICSGKKDRQKLMDFIDAAFPDLASTPYGKHIMAAINKVQRQHCVNK